MPVKVSKAFWNIQPSQMISLGKKKNHRQAPEGTNHLPPTLFSEKASKKEEKNGMPKLKIQLSYTTLAICTESWLLEYTACFFPRPTRGLYRKLALLIKNYLEISWSFWPQFPRSLMHPVLKPDSFKSVVFPQEEQGEKEQLLLNYLKKLQGRYRLPRSLYC